VVWCFSGTSEPRHAIRTHIQNGLFYVVPSAPTPKSHTAFLIASTGSTRRPGPCTCTEKQRGLAVAGPRLVGPYWRDEERARPAMSACSSGAGSIAASSRPSPANHDAHHPGVGEVANLQRKVPVELVLGLTNPMLVSSFIHRFFDHGGQLEDVSSRRASLLRPESVFAEAFVNTGSYRK